MVRKFKVKTTHTVVRYLEQDVEWPHGEHPDQMPYDLLNMLGSADHVVDREEVDDVDIFAVKEIS